MARNELDVLWRFVEEIAAEDWRGNPPKRIAKAQTLLASRCSCQCHHVAHDGRDCTSGCCPYPSVIAWLW